MFHNKIFHLFYRVFLRILHIWAYWGWFDNILHHLRCDSVNLSQMLIFGLTIFKHFLADSADFGLVWLVTGGVVSFATRDVTERFAAYKASDSTVRELCQSALVFLNKAFN